MIHCGSPRKVGLPCLGVLIIRIRLLRVLYSGPLFAETPMQSLHSPPPVLSGRSLGLIPFRCWGLSLRSGSLGVRASCKPLISKLLILQDIRTKVLQSFSRGVHVWVCRVTQSSAFSIVSRSIRATWTPKVRNLRAHSLNLNFPRPKPPNLALNYTPGPTQN